MSIPSDFDPLAWGERRYIQPVIKAGGSGGVYDRGITDESYPYTFKMQVNGTSGNGNGVRNAFDVNTSNYWGAFNEGDHYAIITFEHPLRIVGMQMLLGSKRTPTFKLYGISEGEDQVTEGIKLGEFTAASTATTQYQCLATANRDYYKQYRIDFHCTGSANAVYDIKLDALYRPADL